MEVKGLSKKNRRKPQKVIKQGEVRYKVEYVCGCCSYEGIRYVRPNSKYVYCHDCDGVKLRIEKVDNRLIARDVFIFTRDEMALFGL